MRGPVHPGIRDIWHAPARTQCLTIELSRVLDQSRSSKGMSFWSLFFRERSIAYKLETSVQRPWFVTPFHPRHLSYLHLIGKNNAIPEISIGTTHLLPILAPLISPILSRRLTPPGVPSSELGDLRWRHEVGIGFERRQVQPVQICVGQDGHVRICHDSFARHFPSNLGGPRTLKGTRSQSHPRSPTRQRCCCRACTLAVRHTLRHGPDTA